MQKKLEILYEKKMEKLICHYCLTSFNDYEKHISSMQHKRNFSKDSIGKKYINQMVQKYAENANGKKQENQEGEQNQKGSNNQAKILRYGRTYQHKQEISLIYNYYLEEESEFSAVEESESEENQGGKLSKMKQDRQQSEKQERQQSEKQERQQSEKQEEEKKKSNFQYMPGQQHSARKFKANNSRKRIPNGLFPCQGMQTRQRTSLRRKTRSSASKY